jgi:hypothetical protein
MNTGKLNRNTKEVFATNLKENILSREFHKSSEKFWMELRGKFSKGVWDRCRWIFARNSKVREISHRIGNKLL